MEGRASDDTDVTASEMACLPSVYSVNSVFNPSSSIFST
jgi:hypothetical protein